MERTCFLLALMLTLALGAFLRLTDLGGPSLWLDEILHLKVTQSLADEPWYRHLAGVREVKGGTENGPLYYWLQILGQRWMPGDAGVRLFPALVGILSLPLMAWTGWLLGGRPVSLAATFLLAVSPLHVYFSREGRPYYLLMAMALLLLAALLLGGSRAGVGLAWVACLITAYVGLPCLPLLISFWALSAVAWAVSARQRTERSSPYVHYLAAATLALVLAYGLYMTRSDVNVPRLEKKATQVTLEESPLFLSPVSKRSLQTFAASMTTSGHPTVLTQGRSWVLVGIAFIGVFTAARRRPAKLVATAGMFFLPAALSLAGLIAVGRWYGMRYTTSALPAFLLLTAMGLCAIAELAGRSLARHLPNLRYRGPMWAGLAILLWIAVVPNLEAARTDPFRKVDWRGVASFFDDITLDDEPVVVPNGWPQICLEHYLSQLGRKAEFVSIWESATLGAKAVQERKRGWLLTAGFRSSNEARAWMHQFDSVLKRSEEEFDLFFFPDFATLLQTRHAAGKSAVFEHRFGAMGQRYEFIHDERLLQGEGWSFPETSPDGTTFQWSMGDRAELALPLETPPGSELRLRALPFVYPEAPPQAVEIWLDSTLLAKLELPPKWSEHQVDLPADSTQSGPGLLLLRPAESARPADVLPSSGDTRQLAVAFDFLEVMIPESASASTAPQ